MPTRADFNLLDLVHLAWLVSNDMVFHVAAGEQRGTIVLEQGQIIHAQIQGLEAMAGHQAFHRMLGWGAGAAIQTTPLQGKGAHEHNVSISTKAILQRARQEEGTTVG